MEPLTVSLLSLVAGLVIGRIWNHEGRIIHLEDAQKFCPRHFKATAEKTE